jgi:hypothetical protein
MKLAMALIEQGAWRPYPTLDTAPDAEASEGDREARVGVSLDIWLRSAHTRSVS